jgi:hypothetical protein
MADRRRGRPKGTGINDHEMLLKIAHILAADPAKKRTTAIKEIGITNASVVRRLRDKYQEHEASLMAEIAASTASHAGKTPRKGAPAPAAAPHAGHHEQAHTGNQTGKKAKAAPAPANSHAAAATNTQVKVEPISAAPQAAASPAIDPLAALFEGLNIETLVTQFIGHVLGLDASEIENSPIPALIRQQAQLADLVLPLLASQFMNQKSNAKAA